MPHRFMQSWTYYYDRSFSKPGVSNSRPTGLQFWPASWNKMKIFESIGMFLSEHFSRKTWCGLASPRLPPAAPRWIEFEIPDLKQTFASLIRPFSREARTCCTVGHGFRSLLAPAPGGLYLTYGWENVGRWKKLAPLRYGWYLAKMRLLLL